MNLNLIVFTLILSTQGQNIPSKIDLECDLKSKDGLTLDPQVKSCDNENNFGAKIRPSLFPNVAPYVKFNSFDEAVPKLPAKIRESLTWHVKNKPECEIIKMTVMNSGHRYVPSRSKNWVYYWDKFVKPKQFYIDLKPHQKVNLIPGSHHLFHKEKLWENIQRMARQHGSKNFSFIPKSYILPRDRQKLKSAIIEGKPKGVLWFVKPPRRSQGKGIYVISKWHQVPRDGYAWVVQKYVKPYLINERKFDLRIYVLVTSFNPLKIYLYQDGNVRFAAMKYSNETRKLSEKYIHLTNEAINGKSQFFVQNHDINSYNGHQWSLKMFWRHLETQGADVRKIIKKMEDIIIKTLIAVEKPIEKLNPLLRNRYNAYQLFGFDIGIDQNFEPWLFEVNGSPTTTTTSGLLLSLKGKMFKELFNIVGYHFPPNLLKKINDFRWRTNETFQEDLYTKVRTRAGDLKQEKIMEMQSRDEYLTQILDTLTPEDVAQLMTAEDELSQCNGFKRIFPTNETHSYLNWFNPPRYYNRLLDSWLHVYGGNGDKNLGIQKLGELSFKR